MPHTRLIINVVLLLGFGLTGLHGQENIFATGGDASGSGGSVSYSFGQVMFQTYMGTTGSVSEGVHQPFEISIINGIEDAQGINLTVSAYPNPAADLLILSIEEIDISNFSYQLYDMNGKLLLNEKIVGNKTSIVMSKLVTGNYFVKVIQGNKEVKAFKIIKN